MRIRAWHRAGASLLPRSCCSSGRPARRSPVAPGRSTPRRRRSTRTTAVTVTLDVRNTGGDGGGDEIGCVVDHDPGRLHDRGRRGVVGEGRVLGARLDRQSSAARRSRSWSPTTRTCWSGCPRRATAPCSRSPSRRPSGSSSLDGGRLRQAELRDDDEVRLRHLPDEVAVVLGRRRADAPPDACAHAATDARPDAGADAAAHACSDARTPPPPAPTPDHRADRDAAAQQDGTARTRRDGVGHASRDGRTVGAGRDGGAGPTASPSGDPAGPSPTPAASRLARRRAPRRRRSSRSLPGGGGGGGGSG